MGRVRIKSRMSLISTLIRPLCAVSRIANFISNTCKIETTLMKPFRSMKLLWRVSIFWKSGRYICSDTWNLPIHTQPSHHTAVASLRLQIRRIPSFLSDPHLNCWKEPASERVNHHLRSTRWFHGKSRGIRWSGCYRCYPYRASWTIDYRFRLIAERLGFGAQCAIHSRWWRFYPEKSITLRTLRGLQN